MNNDLDSGMRLLRSYFTFFITFSLMLFNLEVSDACLIHRIQLRTSIDNVKYFIILRILYQCTFCYVWKESCQNLENEKETALEIFPSYENGIIRVRFF